MTDELDNTLDALLSDIEETNEQLASGAITVDEWQADIARSLVEHHSAAYMIGAGSAILGAMALRTLGRVIGEQVGYLNKFADEIAANGWQPAYKNRAAMYGDAIAQSYWRGKTKGTPLPGYPADGNTACLSKCKCAWSLDVLDEAKGDIDAYWQLGQADHCAGCIERAMSWNPYRIRGGEGE